MKKKKLVKAVEPVSNPNPDDCKNKWRKNSVYDGLMLCPTHDVSFEEGKECPKYQDPELYILDKNGNFKRTPSPLFPVETIPDGFEAEKLEFTHMVVDSHRLVVNSQGVVVDFTQLVVRLHDSGLSQCKIAKKLGVTQQYISKVLKPYKGKEIVERFHNFRVKIKAITNYDAVSGVEVRLNNNVSYKKIELADYFIQVFRKSITIVFREHNNISGLDVVSAQNKAFKMLEDVISRLPKEIVITDNIQEVIGRHNAFVNHPSAKYDLKIYDDDGKLRIISDHSKGRFEKEAVSQDYCITDSQKIERHDKDMILREGYTHSETKEKIDVLRANTNTILDVQVAYAEQIKKHLVVQDETLKSLRGIDEGIGRFTQVADKLNETLQAKTHTDQEARLLRVKALSYECW